MGWVSQATEKVSEAATQVLQPVEKAINQGVTDVGRTIANSPVLEGTITAIAAAYGVPPALTAGFLAANKTSQTGGNLEKGLETFILSYGAGELTKSFKAVDLSTPAKAAESVSTAETSTQAAAQAQAQAAAQAKAAAEAATQAQLAAEAQAAAAAEAQAVAAAQAQAAAVAEAQAATVAQAQAAAAAAAEAQAAVVAAEAQAAAAAQAQAVAAAQAQAAAQAAAAEAAVAAQTQAAAQAAAAQAASQAAATTAVPAATTTTAGLLGSPFAPAASAAGSSAGYVGAAGTAAGTTAGLLGSPIAPVTSAAGSSAGYIGATTPIAAPIGSTLAGLGGSPFAPAASVAGATPGYVSASQVGLGSSLAGLGGSPVAPAASVAGSIPGYVSDGGGLLSSIGSTLSNLLPSSSTVSSFLPSLLTGTLQGLGAANTAEKAREAAQIQAAAQVEAARIAADAAKFRPVGVTTRFGASNFTTDAQGNVIGAGYTASPEIKAYQDRLSALAAQGLTGAEGAQAAYAPLTAGAQSLFSLGQGYIQQTPEQQAAAYIAKQQALLAPRQEQQLAQLQNKLLAQGRGGLSVAQGGNLMATNPELAAYYNALAQSNLTLAAQGQQAGQLQAQFGAGLLGLGSDLMGKYYGGQTAAYAPFATAIDTSSGLENLAQQPMTLGTQIGAKTTASAAEAGRLLGQGMLNSAATQAPANAFSYSGNLFSQAANNPQLQAAILKAFST